MKKVRFLPLSHFNDRPAGTVIDTVLIHSMYVPGAARPFDAAACAAHLDSLKLSAHYLIAQRGGVRRLVNEEKRAWHAGVSRMPTDGRANVNDFSIGIELLGDLEKSFPAPQYAALAELTAELIARFPIRHILGHEHVAPGRKVDPGPRFDWDRYRREVIEHGGNISAVSWPSSGTYCLRD